MIGPSRSSTGISPRVLAALAYAGWWVTGVIVWLVERDDRFVRFHAAQSMAAFGLIAVLVSAFLALAAASLSFLPSAFNLFLWAAAALWCGALLVWVVVMWQAASGRMWRIPLAAELADRIVNREL